MIDAFARGMIGVLATFARLVLTVIEAIEAGLRALTATAGLTSSVQSVLLITVLSAFLFAALRLLGGRVRSGASSVLLLTLAHALEHLARG